MFTSSGRVPVLLRPRFLVGHLMISIVVAGCVTAGFWQLDRHRDQQVARRVTVSPAVISGPDITEISDITTQQGVRIQARGRFDSAREFLLDEQTRGDDVGYDVLTPFVLEDGTKLLVDRGFLPADRLDDLDTTARPPDGRLLIAGALHTSQRALPSERVVPGSDRTVERVDLPALSTALSFSLRPVWIVLDAQDPVPSPSSPEPADPPNTRGVTDDVNHLAYVVQWFAFAGIGLMGWPLVMRRSIGRHAHKVRRQPPTSDSTNATL